MVLKASGLFIIIPKEQFTKNLPVGDVVKLVIDENNVLNTPET
jgi:hypothetical protein